MSRQTPAGYTHWMVGGQVILLPERVAKAMKDAATPNDNATSSSGPRKRRDQRQTPSARTLRKRSGAKAQAGHLRVLYGYDSLADAEQREQACKRRSDKDDQDRVRALLEKLASRGPDRRVGRPQDWRVALDALAVLLPHFRGPLDLVRNTLALSEASAVPVRIPPLLLLGPPGVGKTLFSHRLAEMLGVPQASIAFDQANAGSQLFGTDKYWANTQAGLLFQLLCEGEYANPVILLDELDKAAMGSSGSRALDPLAQLHGALEIQTARRAKDVSTDLEFDASLVTYVATANSFRGMNLPLLSRFEVFAIDPPTQSEAVEIARQIAQHAERRLGLTEPVIFDRKCFYVLAHMSPRLMVRTVDKAVAEAVAQQRRTVSEQDMWRLSGLDDATPQTH